MTPGAASPVEALVDAAAGGDILLVTELLASGHPVGAEGFAQKTALAAALDAG
ncbi:hypothetical protein Kisp02_29570 [Kineosporia sp. NBRC 101731]|nr:hypothetical protein Kisp02_29570 [Kineosporia sp. NBRC 101731]